MIINNNIPALNTHRQMGINQNNMQSSMEKLSSGMRINKAGDDAAGLAISEKMRAQINGLDQASRNAQDGISMIQTAEGALDESHSILQRMRELSVQSANDTNVAVDREELQKEVDQLSQELSRIGDNTEFNTQNLLDGGFEGKFQIGANEGQNLSLSIDDMRGYSLEMAGDVKIEQTAAVTDNGDTNTDIADGTYSVQESDTAGEFDLVNKDGVTVATSDDGVGKNFVASTGDDTLTFNEDVNSGTVKIDSGTATAEGTVTNDGLEAGAYTYDSADSALKDDSGNTIAKGNGTTFTSLDGTDTLVTFSVSLTDGDEFDVGGIDISSQKAADAATTKINDAIETVSAQRSSLGATQNRLEHTISNLDNSSENLSAAESRIRDVDMAAEMMEMTRSNILSQASQSMLAQANQQPQSVLQLLG
ncbi:flagellin [Alteribacillus bidgolensis]|uniref:Flagellin n=1 Tax=Alteribacillus bidgolensis TaxID=930129 RepID=A0A1G8E390_9BACI|nr:flagellin [Alteribacillus bidgolensis]SDH64377.1 flagellin [Alteribacillus bidgolensis]